MTHLLRQKKLLAALLAANAGSALLFLLHMTSTTGEQSWFLFYNLLLAWLPLVAAIVLVERLKKVRWSSGQGIGLTFLWFMLLPNSFYIASDLVHLENSNEIGKLYDAVMILSFAFNGFLLGYLSLFLVHRQLLARFQARTAHTLIAIAIFLCSFAIYLGRNLRWNSWDVLINPAGLLFDISERMVHPLQHPATYKTTLVFFILIGTMYWVVWECAAYLRKIPD
jgi:uncharacterized membrane protein